MNDILYYIFYPNPGRVTYTSTSMIVLMLVCAALILLSFGIKFWRGRLQSAITKKLSRSWASLCLWFGIVGLALVIARVEKIQFVAMRFAWVLWAIAAVLAIVIQFRIFRMRHYHVIPKVITPSDPRAKYLPGKKR